MAQLTTSIALSIPVVGATCTFLVFFLGVFKGCLDQRSNILHYDRSSSEEELPQGISQDSEDFSMKSRKDILLTIKSVIKSSCVVDESAYPLKLNIRKNFEFKDFFHFFNKKWNCSKKKDKLYEISFIGESGVDIGELSREFYSGKLL